MTDIETLLLTEIRLLRGEISLNTEALKELRSDIHDRDIETEKRFSSFDKELNEVKFKSGVFGTMGGVLGTVGLTLIKVFTKFDS